MLIGSANPRLVLGRTGAGPRDNSWPELPVDIGQKRYVRRQLEQNVKLIDEYAKAGMLRGVRTVRYVRHGGDPRGTPEADGDAHGERPSFAASLQRALACCLQGPAPAQCCPAAAAPSSSSDHLEPMTNQFTRSLTPAQQAAVQAAREVYVAAGGLVDQYTDVAMARFCIANKWDRRKTAEMLRKTVPWRKAVGADRYRTEFLKGRKLAPVEPMFARYIQSSGTMMWGTTKAGGQVMFLVVDAIDIQHHLSDISDADSLKSTIAVGEFQAAKLDQMTWERADGTLATWTVVIDLTGVSVDHFAGPFRKRAELLMATNPHCPSIAGVVYAANCPGWIEAVWQVVRWVLSEELRDKFQLQTRQKDELPAFTAEIDPKWLPPRYGGTMRKLEAPVELGLEHGAELAVRNALFEKGSPPRSRPTRSASWV